MASKERYPEMSMQEWQISVVMATKSWNSLPVDLRTKFIDKMAELEKDARLAFDFRRVVLRFMSSMSLSPEVDSRFLEIVRKWPEIPYGEKYALIHMLKMEERYARNNGMEQGGC